MSRYQVYKSKRGSKVKVLDLKARATHTHEHPPQRPSIDTVVYIVPFNSTSALGSRHIVKRSQSSSHATLVATRLRTHDGCPERRAKNTLRYQTTDSKKKNDADYKGRDDIREYMLDEGILLIRSPSVSLSPEV